MPGADPIQDRDILAAELDEIRRRRITLGLDASGLDGVSRGGDLIGLALSGGGIRSACFALGVTQALARHRVLSRFDYLSTVSGGGYFGSCLSSLLGSAPVAPDTPPPAIDGDTFPLHLGVGGAEPPGLSYLRSNCDFLAPGGVLGGLRLAAVLIRGVILNVFLFLPWILVAVVLTEISYEVESRLGVRHLMHPIARLLVSAALLLVLTFPFMARLAQRYFTWKRRDRYDVVLTASLVAAGVAMAVLPFSHLMDSAVRTSWTVVSARVQSWLSAADTPAVWGGVAAALVLWFLLARGFPLIAGVTGLLGRLMMWLLGPALVVATYVGLSARFVHLPFVDLSFGAKHAAAVADSLAGGLVPESLRQAIDERLAEEGGKLSKRAEVVTLPGSPDPWIRDSSRLAPTALDFFRAPPNGPRGDRSVKLFPVVATPHADDRVDVRVVLRAYPEPRDLFVLLLFLVVVLINGRLVDVNITSLHGFYRDRLSESFLIRRTAGGVEPHHDGRLSELNAGGTVAPYHLINATVNVSGSKDPSVRGRNADFFLFSKHFVGSSCTGYCTTEALEAAITNFTLASATAVSGAAASPTMGVLTMPSVAGDMMLLDFRLGYWLANPGRIAATATNSYRVGGPGPMYLLREATGALNERGRYVNVSDGGHIENLGVYQLLRRRCRLIVAVDAEADPGLTCDAIATVMRYARIDLGVVIDIDLAALRESSAGVSGSHWALGRIDYGDGTTGQLIYLKASMTGDENDYLLAFRRENPVFPQQSTADQFFNEVRFEVYRALGDHIVERAITSEGEVGVLLRALAGADHPSGPRA